MLGFRNDKVDGLRKTLPVGSLSFELFATVAGEAVELGLAASLAFGPFGCNPPLLLQAVEGRIERALLYLQNLFRYLLYALSDSPSVLRLGGEGAEDEKVECALNEIVGLSHAKIIYNYSVDSQGIMIQFSMPGGTYLAIDGENLNIILQYMKNQAPLKSFNQGDFRHSTGNQIFTSFNGKNPSGGYCAGVAVDWIRRVLLGGRESYDENPSKQRTVEQQQTRNLDAVKRMGNAWGGPQGQNGARELTFVSSATSTKGKLLAALNQMLQQGGPNTNVEPEDSTRDAFGKFYTSYTKSGASSTNQFWSKSLINNMIVDIGSRNELGSEKTWTEFAPFLDTIYTQQRTTRGKTGKRAFTGIEVEDASPTAIYQAGYWTPKLEGMLKNDRGVLLGASDSPSGNSGHAIAIHTPGGAYQLFDPNFGVFTCGTWARLESFLEIIFGQFTYTLNHSNGTQTVIHAPIYGNTTTKNVDWTIFKKAA